MMASELIHKKASEYGPSLHNFLPQKTSVAIWSGLAEAAVKDPEIRPVFQEIARQVESEAHLVQHATDLRALAGVMSIPTVDDRLLEEAAARCQRSAGAERNDGPDRDRGLGRGAVEVEASWDWRSRRTGGSSPMRRG